MLACGHDAKGVLDHCKVVWETPEKAGFGAAALSVADKFRIDKAFPAGVYFVQASLRMAQTGWMAAPADGYRRLEVVFPPRTLKDAI